MIQKSVIRSRRVQLAGCSQVKYGIITYIEPYNYSTEANEKLYKYFLDNNSDYKWNCIEKYMVSGRDFMEFNQNCCYVCSSEGGKAPIGDNIIIIGKSYTDIGNVASYSAVLKLIAHLQNAYRDKAEVKISFENKDVILGDLGVNVCIEIQPYYFDNSNDEYYDELEEAKMTIQQLQIVNKNLHEIIDDISAVQQPKTIMVDDLIDLNENDVSSKSSIDTISPVARAAINRQIAFDTKTKKLLKGLRRTKVKV